MTQILQKHRDMVLFEPERKGSYRDMTIMVVAEPK